ncbi:MAG: hypothetical protein IPK83_19250 [Planctomycetes bacterium]|nr:hypothetical protein [Planctomycetota bacterium]
MEQETRQDAGGTKTSSTPASARPRFTHGNRLTDSPESQGDSAAASRSAEKPKSADRTAIARSGDEMGRHPPGLSEAMRAVSSVSQWVDSQTDEAAQLASLTKGTGFSVLKDLMADETDEEALLARPSVRFRAPLSGAALEAGADGRSVETDTSHATNAKTAVESKEELGKAGGMRNEYSALNLTESDAEMDKSLESPHTSDRMTPKNGGGNDDERFRMAAELRQAQEELRRIRDRTMRLTGGRAGAASGTVVTDDRNSQIRDRVALAQQALDERAQKLSEELAQERERLKAYRDRLQAKAAELLESTKSQKQKLIEQREEIDRSAAELAESRAEFESTQVRLEAEKQSIEADRARLSELAAIEAPPCYRRRAIPRT